MSGANDDNLHLLVGDPLKDAVDQRCDEHLKEMTICGHRLPIVTLNSMPPNEAVMTNGRESVIFRFANAGVDRT